MTAANLFQGQNEEVQNILTDILIGLKAKFVQPVLTENSKLMSMLEEMRKQDQAGIEELKERVAGLEQKVEEIPLLVLSAIRDAINQASGGV
jgi:predicted nuclease with TOPRIM domain